MLGKGASNVRHGKNNRFLQEFGGALLVLLGNSGMSQIIQK